MQAGPPKNADFFQKEFLTPNFPNFPDPNPPIPLIAPIAPIELNKKADILFYETNIGFLIQPKIGFMFFL